MKYVLGICFLWLTLVGCDGSKLKETPDSQFIGTWKLVDRGMLEGLEVKISKDEKGNLIGLVSKLNDNKYVQLFMEVGDKFVSGIKRNSNFEFVLSEKRIAAPLFSSYGQSTTDEFKVRFKDKNTIVLGANGTGGRYEKLN